jgi:hypothetical protein
MPSVDSVLAGLTAIANDWRGLAIAWHVLLAPFIAMLMAGWRPRVRVLGALLVAPLVSVSLASWQSGNPFNGMLFALLAAALIATVASVTDAPVRLGSARMLALGLAFVLFGWTYPHFLRTESWTEYLYSSPFGILPCPTLSVLIGVTLMLGNSHTNRWSLTLAGVGLLYGIVGTFRLGVILDLGLILAAGILAATTLSHRFGDSASYALPHPGQR